MKADTLPTNARDAYRLAYRIARQTRQPDNTGIPGVSAEMYQRARESLRLAEQYWWVNSDIERGSYLLLHERRLREQGEG
jgi:hypothetical protein